MVVMPPPSPSSSPSPFGLVRAVALAAAGEWPEDVWGELMDAMAPKWM